jgi:hypothetical protein
MLRQASATWLAKVRADHDTNDPHRAREANVTPAAYREAAERRIADWLRGREVRVRIKEPQLTEFLRTGVYLSLTASGQSGGAASIENRKRVEKAIFDIPQDAGYTERPVYAYLEGSDEAGAVRKYGTIVLRLRDLTDCSTFTLGDSNDATLTARFPRLAPIPLTSPSLLAASSKTPSKRNNILIADSVAEACEQCSGYVELQIHDELDRRNLVEIVYLDGGQPSQEVLELAEPYCRVRSVAGYDM